MQDVRRLPVGEDDEARVTLADLAREGARRMIATALEADVEEYVAGFAEERDADGKRLVVRIGTARERRLTVGSGRVAIRAPRVNGKRVDEQTGERQRFSSKILPAYARRSPKVQRRAAGALPAGAVDRGLPAGLGAAARRGRSRLVLVDDQPAVQGGEFASLTTLGRGEIRGSGATDPVPLIRQS